MLAELRRYLRPHSLEVAVTVVIVGPVLIHLAWVIYQLWK